MISCGAEGSIIQGPNAGMVGVEETDDRFQIEPRYLPSAWWQDGEGGVKQVIHKSGL